MKRLSLKSKILLGAFLVSGLAAGAQEIAFQIANADDPLYNWESSSSAPENPDSELLGATEADAIREFGCQGTGQQCAVGQKVSSGEGDDTITLEHN